MWLKLRLVNVLTYIPFGIRNAIKPKKSPPKDYESTLPKYSSEEEGLVKAMATKIDTISDEEPEFRKTITDAVSDLSNNPREIKRFINILRFQRNVMAGLEASADKPSFDMLRRWIILSLKWPSVIRWLYWTPGGGNLSATKSNERNTIRERLSLLEEAGSECKDQPAWQEKLEKILNVKTNEVTWIADEDLRCFFNSEGERDPEARLSAKIGKGLY